MKWSEDAGVLIREKREEEIRAATNLLEIGALRWTAKIGTAGVVVIFNAFLSARYALFTDFMIALARHQVYAEIWKTGAPFRDLTLVLYDYYLRRIVSGIYSIS
jgi:hypothetical protein